LAIVAFLVVRFVSKLAVKVVLVGVIVALGAGVTHQRAGLTDCARTSECTIFGRAIEVPRP
jgi:hypothetical protein